MIGIAEMLDDAITLDDFLGLLKNVKRTATGWDADCPICDCGNGKRHLHIADKPYGNYTFVCRCNKNEHKMREVIEAAGGKAAYSRRPAPPKPRREINRIKYEYRYADGSLAAYKFRQEYDDGSKKFFWQRADGTTAGIDDNHPLNMWRLEILAAADNTERLYIVEGEKCVQAMEQAGFVATTAPNGAGQILKLTDEERGILARFNEVVLIPDNDAPGQKYVEKWRNSGVDFSVLQVSEFWPEVCPKGDVADYLLEGGNPAYISNWKPKADIYPPKLNTGDNFWLTDTDVVARGKDNSTMKISSPVTIIRKILNGKNEWMLHLAAKVNGGWQDIYVKPSVVASKPQILKLADNGVLVDETGAKALVQYFTELQKNNTIPVIKVADTLGWHDGVLVPYSDKILVNPVNDGLVRYRDSMESTGTFNAWLDAVKPFYVTVPAVRMAISAAFAGLLNRYFVIESSFCHISGNSGAGKTVITEIAASCFGNPNKAVSPLFHTFKDTSNAIPAMASIQDDIPFFINELQTNARMDTAGLVMLLCDSKEKSRLDRNSSIKKQGNWHCNFITNGEHRLLGNNVNAGAINRVIDVWQDKPFIGNLDQYNAFVKVIHNNYGWAIRRFIQGVNISRATDNHLKLASVLAKEYPNASAKQRNVAASWWAADYELSSIVFGCEPATVGLWGEYFVDERELNTAQRAWDCVMDIIASHPRCFDTNKSFGEASGWERWGKIQGNECHILKTILSRIMTDNGFQFDAVKKEWADDGRLIKDFNGKYAWKTSTGTYIHLKLESPEPF